ncbi:MAG: hypothetical protein ACO1NX_04745 [Chitinophagaceae bacterium]
MKRVMTGMAALWLLLATAACTANKHRYADLNTGLTFELVKDPKTGLLVDAQTGKPLNIYVDRATNDTVDGRTGKIINGSVQKIDNSLYVHADGAAAGQWPMNQAMADAY